MQPVRAGSWRADPYRNQLIDRRNELSLFVCLTCLLTVLSVLYLLELHYVGDPLLWAFLWSQGPDRFGDFWHYRALLQHLHQASFFAANDRFAYPAPCAILYLVLYHLGSHPHVSFNLILWTIEAVSAVLLLRGLYRRGMPLTSAAGLVGLLAVTSYPWHCLYDRGNIEIFIYACVGAGVWAWLTGHKQVAAIAWGLAGSMKLYPVILLAMFLSRRDWRKLALGLVVFASALLLSFWYVGPTVKLAAMGSVGGVLGFVSNYGGTARTAELFMDHSILGALKELQQLPNKRLASINIQTLSRVYEALVLLFAPYAFLRWRRTANPLNVMCALLLAFIVLPPVSYDYTLVYAYLVLGLVLCSYMAARARGQRVAGMTTYMVAFAVICTAQDWVYLHALRLNGMLKCAALIAVIINLVRFPLPSLGPLETEEAAADVTGRPESPFAQPVGFESAGS